MIKQLSKAAIICITLSAFMIAGLTTIPVAAQPQKLPDEVCQCVKFVTNSLFGIGNIVSKGNWGTANTLANQTYWDNAYAEYPQAGLYKQVQSPVAVQTDDVIIMKSNAHVYIKMTNGYWDNLTTVGKGSGHIGFVKSAFYYDGDAEKANPDFNGMSGWLITMQSANWGTEYIEKTGLTDMDAPNVYGSFLPLKNGCTNVNNSIIFLPTGNPVCFWRLEK